MDADVLASDFQSIALPIKVILLVPWYLLVPSERRMASVTGLDYDVLSKFAMRKAIVVIFVAIGLPHSYWPQSAKAILGSWEGESKCTVPDSPCRDEHVLYQISLDKKDPEQLNLDGYKIVDGNPEFMGTLTCQYHSRERVLSCTANTSQHDDWEFHVTDNTMAGRLTINEGKTLYRRIIVHKSETK